MVMAEGIAVSGEYVEKLKSHNFAVVSKPYYKDLPKINKPEEMEKKLVFDILLLDNGVKLQYFPNSTSIKTMVNLWGFEMDNWVSRIFAWEITKQKVRKDMKSVLYVKNEKFEEIYPVETFTVK